MASSPSSQNDTRTAHFDHFTCNICLEVLREPVQCVRNEHYFCKKCINKHLTRSQTCPVCQDELTPETLRPISRTVANILEQFQTLKCMYASRGCTSAVRYEALLSHHEECSFAPAQCLHEGCEATVNRKDLVSHQQACEFRSVTCEDCHEAMKQREYGKHTCVLRRELDENKRDLAEVKKILREIQGEQRRQGEENQRMAKESSQPHATRRRHSDNSKQQTRETKKQQRDDSAVQASELKSGAKQTEHDTSTRQITSEIRQPKAAQIIVAGGSKKSYEVFDWSTQKWTLYEDTLFFNHTDAAPFVYDNKMLICGGTDTNRVGCLDIANDRFASILPTQLPTTDCGKGVLCDDKILTFGESVSAASLKPPFKTTVIVPYSDNKKMSAYGVARINENAVVLVGGTTGESPVTTCDVLLYNPTKNDFKKLAPLPYSVADMAVVVYKDNLVIFGGRRTYHARGSGRPLKSESLNGVLMYNITNQQCRKLPNMLEKR